MSDRESFETVASEIAKWELAAQQLPLAELYAAATTCQSGLADSLNAFNDIYISHDDGGEPSTEAIARPSVRSPGGLPPWRSSPSASPTVRTWQRTRTDISAGPGGRPSPGPASHNSFPYPLKQRRASACPTLPAACPHA